MDDSIKHSDDEVVCTVTYTWGQVKTFLKEHGGCATDSNAEALLAECGNGSIETGKDNLFCDAYDEIEQCLYTSLDADNLPDKPWYDRPKHLLTMRKAHVRGVHRPMLHVRQHRLQQ